MIVTIYAPNEGFHADHFWPIEFKFKLAAEVQIKYDLVGSMTFLISMVSQPQEALLCIRHF